MHDLVKAREEAIMARRQANEGRMAEQRYKDRVREYIIEQAEPHGWCVDGVNRHFDALGLEPWSREYEVQVTCTITTTVTVEADDEGDAGAIVSGNINDYVDMRHEDWDDVSIESVESVDPA
jgi:hypothetical protein